MKKEKKPIVPGGILKLAVPLYQDAIQPSVEELGDVMKRAVQLALLPVRALLWSFEQIEEFVYAKVSERLKRVPAEDLVEPALNVVGPALEALRFAGDAPDLRDLYANLLAAAMYDKMKNGAHPAFVEVIKQLTPDDARLIRLFTNPRPFPLLTVRYEWKENKSPKIGGEDVLVHFSRLGIDAHLECPDMTPTFIDNICRLKLAEIPAMFVYTSLGVYEPLENSSEVQDAKKKIEENPELKCVLQREGLRITEFGKQFVKICVSPQFPS